jgi:membrane-associated protease RseP (regulator of RpoE activity)
MSFLLYDITFLIVFGLFLVLFLRKKRKNLQREGILFLYKTKIGIRLINYIGGKYKKTLNVLQYISIVIGYALMAGILYILGKAAYIYLVFPEITDVIKAPPLMPLIPYFPRIFGVQSLFPDFYFTYFIIAIVIVATVHEFAHGIFAKAKGLRIKSTGFAFLGPLIGAFVEPDEKKMLKKSKKDQIAILSAGVFANVITTIIFFFITWFFVASMFTQTGAIFGNYASSTININSITSVGNHKLENPDSQQLLDLIENNEIESGLTIQLNGETINLTEVRAGDKRYFMDLEILKTQLKGDDEALIVYGDFPAINAGLMGAIIKINEVGIKNQEDLSTELSKYKPGESISIKTEFEDTILSYNIQLTEHPEDESKPFLGIVSMNFDELGFRGIFYKFFNFFDDPSTATKPKLNSGFIIFIKDLLWWIIIINALVALFNMLPVGFLDGGRFFFLSVLAVVKNEKVAKKISKLMVYLIVLILIIMMASWLLALIFK